MIAPCPHGWSVECDWGGGIFGSISGPDGSLDVSLNVPERAERLSRLAAAGGCPPSSTVQSMIQVHGAGVVVASPQGMEAPECDAMVCRSGGTAVAGVTADCVPLILHAPGAASVVHAGWRGLACGVISSAVAMLAAEAGCPSEAIVAHIGPSAASCCYEVGPEVQVAIGDSVVHHGSMLDSSATAAEQLNAVGVCRIEDVGICTICSDPGQLASFRRDGERAGRQGFIAWSN